MSRPWWEAATIYQVYPRSFKDSDGDGVGDLPGVIEKLDHLTELGVDAVWLSPIYQSPMADFGYDVADYCDIDPLFGTLRDMDDLLAAAHQRGLKVLLDFVPNHSSDQHPWFVDSISSRESARRDWYIWRDPAPDGGPPNNWISDFGGSAWQHDATSGQYYYHAFLKEQPDLNWRNPRVREAMLDAMRFWFDRGVDGFRIDVLWHIVKHADLPDNPINPDWQAAQGEMHRVLQTHSTDQPEVHEIAAEMRALSDRYDERLLIGEIYLPVDRLMDYYGGEQPGVHLPFNFQLIDAPWEARGIASIIRDYEAALPTGGWPNWVLGNHDRPRVAARLGEPQARVAAMLLLTLRGTPTIYYGDELGIGAVAIPADRVRDPRELREPGLGLGRDPVRTPMPWTADDDAGFSAAEPWLPLNEDWRRRNVAAQAADARSMLSLYGKLLAVRRERMTLSIGEIADIGNAKDVLYYSREAGGERMLVTLNLGHNSATLVVPDWALDLPILLSTLAGCPDRAGNRLTLRPDEGVIIGRANAG